MEIPLKPVISIDPGREKCGIAVVDNQGKIMAHNIVVPSQVIKIAAQLLKTYDIELFVLGDATASSETQGALSKAFPEVPIVSVRETNSTLEAREVYWRENPPSGWRKIVPLSLQVPPVPIDDYAAVVLALRYWNGRT